MTAFEGMCIGFLAGVVMSLMIICIGKLIDDGDTQRQLNNNGGSDPDLPVGGRDRSGHNRQNNQQGGGD